MSRHLVTPGAASATRVVEGSSVTIDSDHNMIVSSLCDQGNWYLPPPHTHPNAQGVDLGDRPGSLGVLWNRRDRGQASFYDEMKEIGEVECKHYVQDWIRAIGDMEQAGERTDIIMNEAWDGYKLVVNSVLEQARQTQA